MTMHEMLTIASEMMQYSEAREYLDIAWVMNHYATQERERYHRSIRQNTRTWEQLYPEFFPKPYRDFSKSPYILHELSHFVY